MESGEGWVRVEELAQRKELGKANFDIADKKLGLTCTCFNGYLFMKLKATSVLQS